MKTRRLDLALIVSSVLAGGCGSPAGPAAAGHAGQWSGTTTQGRPIAFTISEDETVTTISVEYQFNGCSGSQTFPNLSLSIAPNVICVPGPCSGSLASYRAFHYISGDRIEGPTTVLNALFLSRTTAEGVVSFQNYPGCGSASGVSWTAARR